MVRRLSLLLLTSSVAFGQFPSGVQGDMTNWIPFPLSAFAEMEGTVLDMSFLLEAPAGQHGFLTVKGDRFVFADGTPARFWGGNFFGEANFPNKEEAHRLADVIARSGANIVRLHHLDVVKPWTDKVVQRSLFGGQMPATTRRIDSEMLDRFHYLFHCLKERGVYIFLSHISSRYAMAGDRFPGDEAGFADVAQGFKVEGMFDPYLIHLQKEYLEAILTHLNPYTGLAMKDDPALVLTEVINENTLFWLQPEGWFAIESPYYRSMLQQRFAAWLTEKYQTQETLIRKWQQTGRTVLFAKESLAQANIGIPHIYVKAKDWPVSDQRKRDTYAFLYDLQEEYYQDMVRFLRAIGVKIPIAGSNHWCKDLADLHVNARLDYIDRHAYWTHPENEYNYIAGQGVQAKAMVKDPAGGNIGSLAQRRVMGKPYTVSEWHNPLPNPYRAEGTPLLAAYACLHDWHPMHYAYWGVSEAAPEIINSFEVMFDPTQMNLIPISALLFHRQDFLEDVVGTQTTLTRDQVFDPQKSVARSPQQALIGKYGLGFEGATAGAPEPKQSAETQRSVTGQIQWDTQRGVVLLDAPRTQGVIGFVGGEELQTQDLSFKLTTPFAVVVVSSLTKTPIADSGKLLISTSGDARFTEVQMAKNFSLVEKTGRFPFLMEPIEGSITLRCPSPVNVYALSPGGKPLNRIKTTKMEDGYAFSLKASHRAMHYEVTRSQR